MLKNFVLDRMALENQRTLGKSVSARIMRVKDDSKSTFTSVNIGGKITWEKKKQIF